MSWVKYLPTWRGRLQHALLAIQKIQKIMKLRISRVINTNLFFVHAIIKF